MTRTVLAALVVLALAACGKAAPESDDPLPDATPGTAGDQSSQAVAQASAASAGDAPAAFRQCTVCHATEPDRNLIGPSLAGVHDRKAGSVAGFPYSTALKESGLSWDDATLDRFLESPMKAVPGTKMVFAGIKDPVARREVISHLKAL